MRPTFQAIAILTTAVLLTACGKAGSLTAAPRATAPAAQASKVSPAQAARPQVSIVANGASNIISNGASTIIGNNAAGVNAPISAADLPPLDLAYADTDPPRSPADEAAEDARIAAAAKAAADAPPNYNVDDRMPYGVVLVSRTATTATIAWRTNVPTKGIIQFAKTRDFKGNALLRISPKGFTDQVLDDVAKTDHKYTLTGLSRFTSYTFKVTAQTALGLKFPEQERPFRTKFWALR